MKTPKKLSPLELMLKEAEVMEKAWGEISEAAQALHKLTSKKTRRDFMTRRKHALAVSKLEATIERCYAQIEVCRFEHDARKAEKPANVIPFPLARCS